MYRIILGFAAWRAGSQHKGGIVRTPLPRRGTLAPLGARVQRPCTKQWKGQAAIHPQPCFSPCSGCQSWRLGDRFQGPGLVLDFLGSSDWTTNSPQGWWQGEGCGCVSHPVRTRPAGAETRLCCYTHQSFVFTWHQNWYGESKGGTALNIYLCIKGKSRSHRKSLKQAVRITKRTSTALTESICSLTSMPLP